MEVENKDFDRWLDAALRARVDAEPRAGLEDRVLARLATEPPRKAFFWWPVFVAVAAGLVISMTLAITHSGTTKPPIATTVPTPRVVPRIAEPSTAQASSAMPKPAHALGRHQKPNAVVARGLSQQEQLPKLATFPAPSPPTDEERTLARLAARRGSFEVATSSENVAPLNELSVPELSIKPLEGTPPDNVPQD